MDVLRKAYQRAICIPMASLNILWKEYDQFELGINKVAVSFRSLFRSVLHSAEYSQGRKFLQERSPAYMSARSANTHLDNITRGLHRTTIPRLPPAPGFEGDTDYQEQVELWKRWIAWEKDDPLVLKADEFETYRSRIMHVYKQALMALRFSPELWVEVAEWCFENNISSTGNEGKGDEMGLKFLTDGIAANPESALLALKHADRIESTHPAGEGEEGKVALGEAVRAPIDEALKTLYDMIKKLKDRETEAIAQLENDPTLSSATLATTNEDEDDVPEQPAPQDAKTERINATKAGFAAQIQMLSQHISYLWIALMRAFRRIQGQGVPPHGVRGIFSQARQKGRLTSDVYVENAHIEWDIYQDPVATRIFERGAKLFPEDEQYIVAYLKHLHSRADTTSKFPLSVVQKPSS
jgi:cleavage stimulation factor subunit 3